MSSFPAEKHLARKEPVDVILLEDLIEDLIHIFAHDSVADVLDCRVDHIFHVGGKGMSITFPLMMFLAKNSFMSGFTSSIAKSSFLIPLRRDLRRKGSCCDLSMESIWMTMPARPPKLYTDVSKHVSRSKPRENELRLMPSATLMSRSSRKKFAFDADGCVEPDGSRVAENNSRLHNDVVGVVV